MLILYYWIKVLTFADGPLQRPIGEKARQRYSEFIEFAIADLTQVL